MLTQTILLPIVPVLITATDLVRMPATVPAPMPKALRMAKTPPAIQPIQPVRRKQTRNAMAPISAIAPIKYHYEENSRAV